MAHLGHTSCSFLMQTCLFWLKMYIHVYIGTMALRQTDGCCLFPLLSITAKQLFTTKHFSKKKEKKKKCSNLFWTKKKLFSLTRTARFHNTKISYTVSVVHLTQFSHIWKIQITKYTNVIKYIQYIKKKRKKHALEIVPIKDSCSILTHLAKVSKLWFSSACSRIINSLLITLWTFSGK